MASLSAAKMGSKRVFPLLMSMSLPPVLSMLVQSLYNIVDSMFVAKVSDSAYLAVLYAFPIQNFILSLAVGAGVGLNSYIARKLGAGDRDEADSAVTHGFLLAGVHSLLFVLLGLFFIEPFFRLFTDSAEVLSLGVSYTRIVVFLSCGTIFHITVEKIFQSVGRMVFPMLLQAAGAVINILLDPILIFGLFGFPAMGVEGAAVATIIGQMSAMLLSFLLFFFGKYDVGLKIRGFRFSMKTVRSIYAVAIPSTVMMSIASVLVMGLNAILGRFSEFAVSAFGSYYKLQTFVYMPANGLVQGMRPILSFNYGAKNRTRVMGTLRGGPHYGGRHSLVHGRACGGARAFQRLTGGARHWNTRAADSVYQLYRFLCRGGILGPVRVARHGKGEPGHLPAPPVRDHPAAGVFAVHSVWADRDLDCLPHRGNRRGTGFAAALPPGAEAG